MDTIIRLNCQTAGRDKIVRFFQYSCKTLWYLLEEYRLSSNNSIGRFKSLEFHLSTFRKLLRFGRFIENWYHALKSLNHPDQIIRYTCTLSHLANAMFLLCDHVLWLGRAGLKDIDSKKWFDMSNRYWLYSIIMNLIKDYYELKLIVDRRSTVNIHFMLKHHKMLMYDTLKNSCDIVIPLTALGFLKFNPGLVGVFGMFSSFAGILLLIQ